MTIPVITVAPTTTTTTTTVPPTTTTAAPTTTVPPTTTTVAPNRPPVAPDFGVATDEDTPASINLALTAGDPDGDTLSWEVPSRSAEGGLLDEVNGVVAYTPPPNFNGTDSFVYSVSDGQAPPVSGTVTVSVTAQPDAPTIAPIPPIMVDENAAINTMLAIADIDGDPLTVTISAGNEDGIFMVSNAGELGLAGELNFEEVPFHELEISVSDGSGRFAIETVEIFVRDANDAPVAEPDERTVERVDVIVIDDLTENDTDEDAGDVLTVASVTNGVNGTVELDPVDGTVTYRPAAGNFATSDTFTYILEDQDGAQSEPATVTLEILFEDDGDGIPPDRDVCAFDFDPFQRDSDGDGIGDVCDGSPGTPPLLDFPDSQLPATSGTSTSVAADDLNGDGFVDLVVGKVALGGRDTIEVFLNDGTGAFVQSPASGQLGTETAVDVALADFDQDSDIDLVAVHEDGTARVYLNDGNGVFTDPEPRIFFNAPTDGQTGTAVDVGDINEDGYPDLVVTRVNPPGVTEEGNSVFLNGAAPAGIDPFFIATGTVGRDGQDVQIVDIDGVGGPEIHIVGIDEIYFWFFMDGVLSDETRDNDLGASAVLAADLLADDGLPELVWSDNSTETTMIRLNTGIGFFVPSPFTIGSGAFESLAAGNVNGDDRLDIVAVEADGQAWQAFLNDGVGRFDPDVRSPIDPGTQDLVFVDVNNDTVLDVVTVGANDDYVYLLG